MSSQAACRARSLSSLTVLETTVASSRSRASGRNTTWEPPWREPVTRQSGTTMSPNCMNSWLENKRCDSTMFGTKNSHSCKKKDKICTNHLHVMLFFPPSSQLLSSLAVTGKKNMHLSMTSASLFCNKFVKPWNSLPFFWKCFLILWWLAFFKSYSSNLQHLTFTLQVIINHLQYKVSYCKRWWSAKCAHSMIITTK